MTPEEIAIAFSFPEGLERIHRHERVSDDSMAVGLGGNIRQSFVEFVAHRTEFTTAGDLQTSGNGSLMRNAPIAVYLSVVHLERLECPADM